MNFLDLHYLHKTLDLLFPLRYLKLEFAKYNGSLDTIIWLCQYDQFFDVHNVSDMDRVMMASLNLKDNAQPQFQPLKQGYPQMSWEQFKEKINIRFGPKEFNNLYGDLIRIATNGSIKGISTQILLNFGKMW